MSAARLADEGGRFARQEAGVIDPEQLSWRAAEGSQ